jgi:beta-N-acetylhexosaminidase
MLDIDGTRLTPADRELLREPAVGGVILFTRNFESVEQVTELVQDIRRVRRPPLLIAVDHEGGRVQRFREGFTVIPAMREIGRVHRRDPKQAEQLARTAGWLIGSELRAVDIDLCFGPCVDLDWGVSEIIGDRAFHGKPHVVADLATHFSRGLSSAGMAAVAKHFPGHGAVVADSHLKLPVDRRDYGDVLDDMLPYERLISARAVAGVMMAHIVYSGINPDPAGFSRYWIEEELRGRIGFDGAVFSDDLSMKATREYGSMPDRAKLTLGAGCDMAIICNDRPAAQRAVAALADYSNPVSQIRLARLHGTGGKNWAALHKSEEWEAAVAALAELSKPPELILDA